jgi:phosphatidylglycerophosphate synthase
MGLIADILTAVRLGIAAFIIYAGLRFGVAAFGAVAGSILLGWTLDTLDGFLARAAKDHEPSWWGSHERQIDAVMVVAGFIYLTIIGIVPVWLCIAYLTMAVLLVARYRSIAVMTVLEAPLVLLIPMVAFFIEPFWGWLYVGWGLVAVLLDRRRFRVRLQILWDDAQRLRERLGGEITSPSTPGQPEEGQ